MKAVFSTVLAIATFAIAQDSSDASSGGSVIAEALSKIPQCALQCFQEATSGSGCDLTDVYCQCTTGAKKIAEALGPCLCKSTCQGDDWKHAAEASNGLCAQAFSAKSEPYTPQTAGLEPAACSATAAPTASSYGTSSGSTAAIATAPATGNSTGTLPIVYPTTNTTGGNATASGSATASLASSTGGAGRISGGLAMVGVFGMALLAL